MDNPHREFCRHQHRVLGHFPDYKTIDIGSFAMDITRMRTELGWEPQVPLREGLAQTLEFYRRNLDRYLG